MKIKTFKKILVIMLLLVLVNMLIPLKVNAVSDMFESADKFLSAGRNPSTVIDTGKVQSTSNTIYKWLMTIAICVAVIIGAIIGIQFITGSVEGKAKIQEALVPYIVGCMVVFGSFFIWKTLVNTGNKLEGDTIDSAETASQVTVGIDEGNVDVTKLSDADLKRLWSNNAIDSTIATAVKGTASDPRSGGKGTPGVTLDVAISQLSGAKKKIYDECNKRGLIETYKDKYIENGKEKEATFVRLK